MTKPIQGTIVLGFGPVPMEWLSKTQKLIGDGAALDPDVARMAGAHFAVGPRAALDALRTRLEAGSLAAVASENPGLSEAATKWLASGERGVSSNTIFSVLTGIDATSDGGQSHPWDPADFRRCRLLLEQVPELAPLLPQMAAASPQWARLVSWWSLICTTMDAETPDWRNPSLRATARNTYDLIKQAIGR